MLSANFIGTNITNFNIYKEKYNEDFEIISLGGRGGTLTNDTFTIKCYPVSDPDCIFKAEI